jgi:hypothetical protein
MTPNLAGPAEEMNLGLLRYAHPEFSFSFLMLGWGPELRYEAVSKNPAAPGLYAVITTDPGELHEILKRSANTY